MPQPTAPPYSLLITQADGFQEENRYLCHKNRYETLGLPYAWHRLLYMFRLSHQPMDVHKTCMGNSPSLWGQRGGNFSPTKASPSLRPPCQALPTQVSPLWVCFLTHYKTVCTGNFGFLPSQMAPDWMIPYPTVYTLQSLFTRKGEERKKSWCAASLHIPREKLGAGCIHVALHVWTWKDWECVIQERMKERKVMKRKVTGIIETAALQWIFSMDQAFG